MFKLEDLGPPRSYREKVGQELYPNESLSTRLGDLFRSQSDIDHRRARYRPIDYRKGTENSPGGFTGERDFGDRLLNFFNLPNQHDRTPSSSRAAASSEPTESSEPAESSEPLLGGPQSSIDYPMMTSGPMTESEAEAVAEAEAEAEAELEGMYSSEGDYVEDPESLVSTPTRSTPAPEGQQQQPRSWWNNFWGDDFEDRDPHGAAADERSRNQIAEAQRQQEEAAREAAREAEVQRFMQMGRAPTETTIPQSSFSKALNNPYVQGGIGAAGAAGLLYALNSATRD